MRTILFLLQKEFIQIFRNKSMLPIIFLLPIIQLLILANAATQEMKNINLAVVDFDNSTYSQRLINAFYHSSFYTIIPTPQSENKAIDLVHNGNADAVLVINHGFEKNLVKGEKVSVQLLVNSINGTAASLINGYTSSIIQSNAQLFGAGNVEIGMLPVHTDSRFWYNPDLNYKLYMVPGILVILVTIIGMFLTALNIVREKELGTIEQINVTPIKKYQFIVGKLLPFWIIALFELAFGLIIARLVFNLTILGSIPLLFTFAAVYLLVALSFGLILSTSSSNQQQVMFLTFFFMIVFIMMSGLFTPTESMPKWANYFNTINPLYYFMRVNRMIILKGSGFRDIFPEFISMSVLAIVTMFFAVNRYKKTV
ncbi:MAG TPA: ABC transporter permease [Tenuifilaceae bacterium]|nr:ABC transporter permease [Tenuifilaceae bacterium]